MFVCEFSCGLSLIYSWCLFLHIHISPPAEECSYWLPLYGSMCCRLAAQPLCMTQQMMSGCLKVKVSWQLCVFQKQEYSSQGFHSFWPFSWFISVLFTSSTSLPSSSYSAISLWVSPQQLTHIWSFSLPCSSWEVTPRVGQKWTPS